MTPEPPKTPADAKPKSRLRGLLKKAWWLHSAGALSIGIGVMLFARHGLEYANELLIALGGSWLLVFVAFRFIVGPTNRKPDEKLARKGLRLATNYIIKQFYQQMFFFLVPLYASSATWSLESFNWWPAPILLVCGVVSTMDLVFDNYIMERRLLASAMYGLAMFGLLNVLLPLAFGVTHGYGLLVAAGATPAAVALLSFPIRSVTSPAGVLLWLGTTAAMLAFALYARILMPPAPLSMPESTVGHGTLSTYECLPPSAHAIRESQLDGLRCGSWLEEPGGLKEDVVHVWMHGDTEVARLVPERVACDGEGAVFRSFLPAAEIPADPRGKWSCRTMTRGGQLVGLRIFSIIAADTPERPGPEGVAPRDAGPGDAAP